MVDLGIDRARRVDIVQILDEGPFTLFQIGVIALAATTTIFDGVTNQLIGYGIPYIAREWAVKPGAFAPAVAAGLFGMVIGSACVGPCADRFGRRKALIACALIFGIFTSLINLATNIAALSLMRFVAALGIGGAIPISTTLAAEFAPLRHRTPVVTVTAVCYPLGGMVAGIFATRFLPSHGWRALFLVCGVLPLILLVALLVALPESPRFLARRPDRWMELRRLLARMRRAVEPGAEFVDLSERVSSRDGFSTLFKAEYRRDTIALWCACFMCMLAVYTAFSWLPAMLVSNGMTGTVASSGLTAYNLGGVLGAIICAFASARFGSRVPMLTCCAGAVVSVLLLSRLQLNNHASILLIGLAVHGLFVNAVQSTIFALTAYVYPTSIRVTGTASTLAFGRIGAVVSSYAGAAVIVAGGSSGYLYMLAAAMALVFIALAAIRHHTPAVGRTE
jgi:MFS transporter, AAHS family, 4-hydroxybenzoate transporter